MSVTFIALAVVLYPLHLEHPDWLPIYDLLPEQAAEEHVLVMGQHFHPFPSVGYVVKKGKGWEMSDE
jgi:hypothetical protein